MVSTGDEVDAQTEAEGCPDTPCAPRRHAAPIADEASGTPAPDGPSPSCAPAAKPAADGFVSRIGTYTQKRREAASARQVLRATQRELDKLRSDLAHRRDIEGSYDSIVSTQQDACDKAQASREASVQAEKRLEKELPEARDALEQMRRAHKEQEDPMEQAADAAKQAVRDAEREIARAQKERDVLSKQAWTAQASSGAGLGRGVRDEALARREDKMAEVTEMHTRLGELRNEQGRTRSELEALRQVHRGQEQPLYEKVERLQAELKKAQRNIKRQDKLAADARAALDEANAIHDDPQATEALAQKVDTLAGRAREQGAQHDALKAEASAAAKKAHVGRLAGAALFVLVAAVAIVLILLFAGR